MACNSMFGKFGSIHWTSKVELSKQKEAEIDSYFVPKVDFLNPQDEYDLKKTFGDLENLYREKIEKRGIVANKRNGMGKNVEK